jgi:ParB family chromosome partitioning protein
METTQGTGNQQANRSVLGRGIGSLLPETNKRGYILCAVGELYPNPAQPRKHFDPAKLDELAQSIREKGVLQPILAKKTERGYMIIAGERRWRASQIAGKKEVPVIIKELSDHEILELALIENIQREDLNPIEEAESYQRLIIDLGLTQDEISKRVGKDRSTIANALRLLKLSKEVREKISSGELSVGHARCLITLEDKKVQNQIMEEILTKQYSVRQVEALVKRFRGAGASDEPGAEGAETSIETELAGYGEITNSLRKLLDTKVEIRSQKAGRGQLVLHFLTPADLNKILGRLGYGSDRQEDATA